MKRTSLWEIWESTPIVTRIIVRMLTRMFEDGRRVVFQRATTVNGR